MQLRATFCLARTFEEARIFEDARIFADGESRASWVNLRFAAVGG